jgi:hypothetical protein
MATCVRTARYKIAYYQGIRTGEMYDLQNDPNEVTNLWNSVRHTDAKAR